MKSILSIVFFLLSLNLISQSYQVIIDGRLPPGIEDGEINYGDGTFTARGGSVNFSINNYIQENVQFREILDNRIFTRLNLRIEYYPVPCPNETFGKGEAYDVSELIPGPNQNRMGISQCDAYISVDAIPENMIITTNTTTVCAGGTIDLLNSDSYPIEARTWRYRIPAYQGNPPLSGYIPDNFLSRDKKLASFNMQDLLGEETRNYIGSTVEFYMGYGSFKFSESAQVAIDDCTPLLEERYPENTSCTNSGDGSVEIAFERGLVATDNETLLATVNAVTPEGFVIPEYNVDILSLTSSSNGPNTYNLPDLVSGTYQIDYQSYIDSDGPGGEDPYPNGLGVSVNFEIRAPSPVVIDNMVTIQNPSCPGQFGERTIEVSGGQGFKSGAYHFTKDGGLNWDVPINPNAVAYTYNDLIPGNDYTFGVKLVFTDGSGECISDSSIDQSIPDITNPIMLAPGTGISNQPSNASATDGIIYGQVSGGVQDFTFELYLTSDPVNPISSILQPNRIHQFTNLGIGSYFLKIRDDNGCEVENEGAPFELAAAPLPSLGTPLPTPPTCNGMNDGSVSVSVTYPTATTFSYELRNGTTVLQSGNTATDTINIETLTSGNYFLFVISEMGDFDIPETVVISDEIIINNPDIVTINSFSPNDISCFGSDDGSISITASGGTSYEYSLESIPGLNGWTPLVGDTIANLSGGFYYLTIRNENGCQSDRIDNTNILINEPGVISVVAVSTDATTNGGFEGNITLNITGGVPFDPPAKPYTINWTQEKDGNLTTFEDTDLSTPYDIINLESAIYRATITDSNGCIFFQSFEITEPGELVATIAQSVFLECNGDNFAEITANVQGGVAPYSFEWFETTNGSDNLLSEDTNIIGNLSPGTYFLRVTDVNSIIVNTNSIDITAPEGLLLQVDGTTDVLCNGAATGAVIISISGGTLPYSFFWNNGATSLSLTGVEAGDYTLEVVDGNGCLGEVTATVNAAPDTIQIVDSTVTNVSGYLANDGSISLDIIGGATPYTINWVRVSDNAIMGNQNTIADLSADLYQVTISDANGCTITETYEITQPDVVEETIRQPTCSGGANGSIALVVNQGNGDFTYEWNTGATGNSITGLAAGSYTVTISGFGNGPLTRTYIIEDPLPLNVDLGEDRVLCMDQELLLDSTVEDETAIYQWTSDNGIIGTTPTITVSETGNYSVTVQTATGCVASGDIYVTAIDDEINAEFAVSSQVFVGESLVAVDISYPLPESIQWVVPEGGQILKENNDEVEVVFAVAGEYEIGIVTNIGVCSAQQTKKVIVVEKEGSVGKETTQSGKKQIIDFVIHPNPTNGRFTAQVGLSARGNISIKIFNFANNAMVASKKDQGKEQYAVPFDISGVPSGVYVVLLETPYGNTVRKIVVK